MTMLHIECPWCAGQASIESDAGNGDTFRCVDCAVSVDLADPSTTDGLAAAA
jgi:sarcosine oxidase delta subunit